MAVVALVLLPAFLIAPGVAIQRQFEREHVLRAKIRAVYEYRTNMRSVLLDLEGAETGQRGYLLTGRRSYLAPYERARSQVTDDLRSLARTGTFGKVHVVAQLAALSKSKFQELGDTIQLNTQGRPTAAMSLVRSDVGQHEMEAARELVAAERDRTLKLMTAWNRDADQSARTTQRTAVLMGGLMILTLVASALLVVYVLIQRRRAIAVLLSTHARLDELLHISDLAEQTSKSGHWSLSPSSGDHRWSAGMFPIFGLSTEAPVPEMNTVLGMYAADDRRLLEAHLNEGAATHRGFELELELVDVHGSHKHVRLKADYIADATGWTLVGALQDVSGEHQTQLALVESEERYRHLAETSTDMMATMSVDSTVLYVSPACHRILGYRPEELIGRSTLSLTHPEDVPTVLATFAGLRRAGPVDATMAYRFRGRHKDGAWVWLEGQPRVEFDAAGTPVRYQDIVREIGSRKAAEEALETSRAMAMASERRYRLLAENATDMIARYGLDGVITYVSPACRKVLGYDPSELVGRTTLSLIHPDDLDRVREQFAQHRMSPSAEAMHTEYRVARRDGTVIWLEGRPKLMFDEAGAPLEYQDVMRDTTARKDMEAELREARSAAESAGRSKADFLANMSHELRTPLNSIVGFSSLIVDAPELGAETRHRARIVRDSSRTLVSIVDDILDFSKFEAEGVVLSPEPTILPHLLRSTLEIMRQQADVKGILLKMGDIVDPGPLLIDPARVRQVIFNLVGNAIKFTERGAVTLALAEITDGRLRLSVQDTGVGMPKNRLGNIFERFAQVDASTSRRFGGTGLGLTICSSIVRAMDGEIGVQSEEGVGSTFWFTVNPPRVPQAPSEPLPESPPNVGASPLSGVRVLIADDNIFNQELFEALVAGHGLEITGAINGLEALELAGTAAFDLVLMDMQMPVMDGLEATRAIRELGLTRLPIVALTANVVPSQIALCLAAGMNDHLAKPYRVDAALAMIARWTVDRGESLESPAAHPPRRLAGAA